MTGAAFAKQLTAHGLDPIEIPATAALYDTALDGFRTLTARTPSHAWWVPGRLEVFGKHTDYAGGRTLVAAVPRGFAFLASPRADQLVQLVDARTGERVTFEAEHAGFTGWRHYAEVALARLARNFPGARRGADIVFTSNLPRASGMSSSSALVVGIATILAQLWSLAERTEWQQNIQDGSALATYLASIENGSPFGGLEGDAGVGTHGGSEDHAAMLLSLPGEVSAYSFVPIRHLDRARVPEGWRFVIGSSGVRAEKTGSARAAYNRLSEGAGVLLRLWNSHQQPSRSLAAALARDTEAADRLRELIRVSDVPGWTPDALERRLEHFRKEDARVPEALQAVAAAEVARLTGLSEASQRDAHHLLGNQIPQTVGLAELARACGAFAASSFGAGFGGSVWALVGRERARTFAARWLADYRREYQMKEAVTFIATPGPAVAELAL